MSFMDDYEPVSERLDKFWAEHALGRVVTSLVSIDEEAVMFRAELYRDGETEPYAVGHAREVIGEGNVNKTSALENCETSAVGRALANGNFASRGRPRPSREEMQSVENNGRVNADKRALVEECKRRGIPSTKANMDMIAAELSGEGPVDEAREPGAEPSPDPADEAADLAGTPCSRCGSVRSNRVQTASGAVVCQNRKACDERAAEEAPF